MFLFQNLLLNLCLFIFCKNNFSDFFTDIVAFHGLALYFVRALYFTVLYHIGSLGKQAHSAFYSDPDFKSKMDPTPITYTNAPGVLPLSSTCGQFLQSWQTLQYALIKKKTKFSSNIRKFRWDRALLQGLLKMKLSSGKLQFQE